MANTFSCLIFHVIWSTKNRLPFITPEIKERLYAYIGAIVQKEGGKLLCVGGVEDHVHILISSHPNIVLPNLMRAIKAKSSAFMKNNSTHKAFGWQDGYGIFSVSVSAVEKVIQYINQQEEHHKKISFQDEFKLFLKRHQIQYDEKYLP